MPRATLPPARPTEVRASPSNPGDPGDPLPGGCEAGGSIIRRQDQVRADALTLAGTPYELRHASNAQSGLALRRRAIVPITGPTVPAGAIRIEAAIEVAGQHHGQSFAPDPNQFWSFTRDGNDAFGRAVTGPVEAMIELSYVDAAVYDAPAEFPRSFRSTATGEMTMGDGAVVRTGADHSSNLFRVIGTGVPCNSSPCGEGEPAATTPVAISRLAVDHEVRITTLAGTGLPCPDSLAPPCELDVPAPGSPTGYVQEIAVGADGSIHLLENIGPGTVIRTIDPDGVLRHTAGTKEWCNLGVDPWGEGARR